MVHLAVSHLQGHYCFKCVFTVSSEREIHRRAFEVWDELSLSVSQWLLANLLCVIGKFWPFPVESCDRKYCSTSPCRLLWHHFVSSIEKYIYFNQHKFAQTDRPMAFICRSYVYWAEAVICCCSLALKQSLLFLWFSSAGSVAFVFVPSVVQVLCWSWQKARTWQMSDDLFREEFSCRRGNAFPQLNLFHYALILVPVLTTVFPVERFFMGFLAQSNHVVSTIISGEPRRCEQPSMSRRRLGVFSQHEAFFGCDKLA